MKFHSVLALTFLLLTTASQAGTGDTDRLHSIPLPLDIGSGHVKPLRLLVDNTLEKNLARRLENVPAWKKLIHEKKLAVGLVDLSDPLSIRFARINGNHMMYAASLPKIAVLLATFHYFQEGSLIETPEITRDLNLMIRNSDNAAATRMINRIGMKRIQDVLTLDQYEFYDTDWGGGLWVGKAYACDSPRYPEPLKGLSHAATVSQVCRFYYQLAMGKLVSREKSRQMLSILADPGINHKFVNVLRAIAPKAILMRKSGTWKIWHADSVLVWGPEWRRYIAVALVESKDGETILRKLIPVIEAVLKQDRETE